MNKNNRKYWRQRAIDFEKRWTKRSQESVERQLAKHYKKSLKAIQDDILKLYGTFAKDNGLDFDEAKQLLGGREFREWRMSMREYLDAIAKGDRGLERELNTLAMRPRINRLEKLYAETIQELDRLGRKVDDDIRNFLSENYTGTYVRNIFDLVKVGGLQVAISKLDSIGVEKVIASRWSGKNFSDRIWNNKRLLSRALKSTIASGVQRGLSIPQLSKMIDDKMKAGYNNAVRLVRTEMNFVNNQAHADSMKDAGVEAYEFIAVMDNRTSTACKTRDGETYLLEEKSVGFNYPPLHPRCRSTVCPFIEGVSRKGTRTAKVGGKNIDIPEKMKYADYEKVYVKKEMTLDEWKTKNEVKSVKPVKKSESVKKNKPVKRDFKAKIDDIKKIYSEQKANGATPAELEKTIKSAGKLVVSEVKKVEFMQTDVYLHKLEAEMDKAYDVWTNSHGLEKQRAYKRYEELVDKYDKEWFKAKQEKSVEFVRAEKIKDVLSRARNMGATKEQLKKQFINPESSVYGSCENALNCYPSEWIEQSTALSRIRLKKADRGYYFNLGDELAISGEGVSAFKTAVHEFGHRMEYTLDDVHIACKQFYSRRTAGESLEKLKNIFPNAGYSDSELTRKDKFLDVYMGKDYGGRSYELVSMGFEYAFTDPMKLLQDEDMAEWIFGLLAIV